FLPAEVNGRSRDRHEKRRKYGRPESEEPAHQRVEAKRKECARGDREGSQAGQSGSEDFHSGGDAPVIEVGLAEPARSEGRNLRSPRERSAAEAPLPFVAVHAAGPAAEPVDAQTQGQEEDQRQEPEFDTAGNAFVPCRARSAGARRLPGHSQSGAPEKNKTHDPDRSRPDGVVIHPAQREDGKNIDPDRQKEDGKLPPGKSAGARCVVGLRRRRQTPVAEGAIPGGQKEQASRGVGEGSFGARRKTRHKTLTADRQEAGQSSQNRRPHPAEKACRSPRPV